MDRGALGNARLPMCQCQAQPGAEVEVARVQALCFDLNAKGSDQGWAFKAKGPPEPSVQAIKPGPWASSPPRNPRDSSNDHSTLPSNVQDGEVFCVQDNCFAWKLDSWAAM